MAVLPVTSTAVNGKVLMPGRRETEAGPLCCAPLTAAAMSQGEAEAAARVLSALADPVRLRLLSIVAAEGEVCSCNLEAPLGKSQPTISHHTRVLADAGLIVGERQGRWTWWRIVPEGLEQLRLLLGGR
jgi:ArsR family transcriptional regulator, arsenate/arsenite/antimonite-responsive transcriptional repressor